MTRLARIPRVAPVSLSLVAGLAARLGGGRDNRVRADPAQGAGSHVWPREREIRYADEAGYELVSGVYENSRHLILVFKVKK